VALARQIGVLHLRLGPRGALEIDEEGPELGETPEVVHLRDTEGRLVTIGGPGDGQLVLFVSPECSLCRTVLPSLSVAARAAGLEPRVVVDAPTAGDAGRDVAREVPVVLEPPLAAAYRVPGTPYVVALDSSGVVRAKGTVNNLEQMEGLVDTARRRIAGSLPHTLS
jgi:methylamine dehydrogenase accessory protein MauD